MHCPSGNVWPAPGLQVDLCAILNTIILTLSLRSGCFVPSGELCGNLGDDD